MSISGYFGHSPNELRADRKDRGPQKETAKQYVSIDDYDPVLRWHCRLAKPDPAPPDGTPDYWTRALAAYFKTQR